MGVLHRQVGAIMVALILIAFSAGLKLASFCHHHLQLPLPQLPALYPFLPRNAAIAILRKILGWIHWASFHWNMWVNDVNLGDTIFSRLNTLLVRYFSLQNHQDLNERVESASHVHVWTHKMQTSDQASPLRTSWTWNNTQFIAQLGYIPGIPPSM